MKILKKLFYCLLMFSFVLSTGVMASAQTMEKRSLTLDGAERVIAAGSPVGSASVSLLAYSEA